MNLIFRKTNCKIHISIKYSCAKITFIVMQKFVLFSLFIAFTFSVNAQNYSWANSISSSGSSSIADMVTDNAGNSYSVGTFTATTSFGSTSFTSLGSYDAFVCKRSPSGAVLWAVRVGGSSQDNARGVALDTAGNVVVVGDFAGTATFGSTNFASNGGTDIFIMKVSSAGTITWTSRFGGTGNENANDVCISKTNLIYLIGNFFGTATFGSTNYPSNGGSDIFTMRLGATGALLNSARFGGTSSEYGNGIALDTSSRVLFTGYYAGSLTFGSTTLTSAGSNDVYVVSAGGTFTPSWANSYGGSGDDQGNAIATDRALNVYFTGTTSGMSIGSTSLSSYGATDAFIGKVNILGTAQWAKNMGSPTFDYGRNIAININGDIVCSGDFTNTCQFGTTQKSSSGGRDVYVVKFNPNGNYSWVNQAGGANDDYGFAVSLNANTVHIGGEYRGAADFGAINVTSSTGAATDIEAYTAAIGLCPTSFTQLNVSSCGSYTLNNQTYTSTGVYEQTLTNVSGCDSIVTLNLSVNTTGEANLLWAKSATGNGSASNDVTTDANGNVYTTGWFEGASDFNPGAGVFTMTSVGTSDIFVSKLDAGGNLVWAKQFGSTSSNKGIALTTDAAGNVYVAGTFFGTADFNPGAGISNLTSVGDADIFIVKLDPSGNFVWAKQVGSSLIDAVGHITLDANNNVLLAGSLQGTGDFDPGAGVTTLTSVGNYDGFLLKLDNAGSFVWVKQMGDVGADYIYDLALDESGFIYATGQFGGTVDFDPGAGTNTITSNGDVDVFIWKLNSAGDFVFVKQIGSTLGDYGSRIIADQSGYIHIAGRYKGAMDFDPGSGTYILNVNTAIGDIFVLKLDTAGNFAWAYKLGGATEEYANGIQLDAANDVIVTGTFSGNVDFNSGAGNTILNSAGSSDIFIMKLDQNGGFQWAQRMGSTFMDNSNDLHIDNNNTMYIAGSFYYTVDFDPGAGETLLTTNIGSDAFVAKYGACCISSTATITASACQSYTSPSGNHTWTTSGTYIDTISNGNGCDSIITIQLTIKQNSGSTINQSICQGQAYFFNGANRTVQGAYLDTLTNSAGCDSIITLNLTVNALPSASIAPTTVTICNGQSATLTASGGGTYAWSNTGGSNAAATFSPTTNTTYTVTVTNANNCSATASKLVTVNALPAASISPATVAICNGQSTTLTASGGGTYAWSNTGGSNAAATFSPTTSTTYTVTVIGANACTASASRLVTVNPIPNAAITPSSVSICIGANAILSASGGTSFAWSNSGGSGTSAIFVPTTSTTYTVTVTDNNNCTATASRLVTVNPLPSPSISPATVAICSGQTTTLTASGGGTYTWSNSGGPNANATFSPTSNTTYTVTVTDANNCSAAASRLVTVNALPNATINPTTVAICNGQSTTLTASGGGTYVWSNSGGANATANFSPTSSTTYTVTVTNANNCSASAVQLVTVNAIPNASINPTAASICNGQSTTLTASGGGTYTWSNTGGSNAAATFSPSSTTTYTVTVTNANNCTAAASSTVTVNPIPNATINGPTTICAGLSATLTASGGGTYAWSGSLGSAASITVTPTATTTYTVTVTGTGSCTATASQTVSVQSAPTATITGSASICAGGTATLTANGGNTYTWANSLGSNAAINVSPTQTTTYTVTVSVGANCTASTTKTVTVNLPSTAQVSQSICSGQSYAFNGNTLTQTGTYKDTLVNANGCDSIITLTLTVKANSASTINTSICNGSTYNFNGQQISQGGTYKDTLSNSGGCDSIITLNLTVKQATSTTIFDSICSGNSYNFGSQTLNQTGVYSRTITNAVGCDSVITLHLFVRPAVIVSASALGFNLSATPVFSTYQWKLNGNVISGANAQTYTAVANGAYTVEVTDANGCKGTSNTVNITGVGIEDLLDFKLSIYPNPAVDIITIKTDELVTNVDLFNAIGQKINVNLLSNRLIDIKDLAAGAYSLIIHTTNGSTQKRFVKE